MKPKFLVIGSAAARIHFPDFPRLPKDLDILSPAKIESADCHWHPQFQAFLDKATSHFLGPEELYTIKLSHAFWDVNWEKTMHDILFFQSKGIDYLPKMFNIFYSVWEEVHGPKKANLNVMAEDFFKSTVKRIYEHDSIHASIAYHDKPLFNEILKDGAQVAVDRAKFEAMPLQRKFELVREEVYATALERLVIPSDYKYSPRAAYAWALKKTITSFSKGWFPLFIVENFSELHKPDVDYVKRHKENADKLIPLEG